MSRGGRTECRATAEAATISGKRRTMKIEINTNGAWRTVLSNLGKAEIESAGLAALLLRRLAHKARQRLSWRVCHDDGQAVAHIDSTDCNWAVSGHRHRRPHDDA